MLSVQSESTLFNCVPVEVYYKSFRMVPDVFEVSGHSLLSVQSESTLSQWLHQAYTIIYMSAVTFCETRNTSVRQMTMVHACPGHALELTILLGHNGRCTTDRGRYPTFGRLMLASASSYAPMLLRCTPLPIGMGGSQNRAASHARRWYVSTPIVRSATPLASGLYRIDVWGLITSLSQISHLSHT